MEIKTDFEKKVYDFLIKNKLVKRGQKVLVCLSGGADSVCLLRVMHSFREILKLELEAAHVNHMLRGEAADGDEAFCASLCDELGVKLHVLREDVAALAKTVKESVEAVARKVRYDYFFSLKNEFGFDLVLTAHNQNDNAETSLMYYLRGSGIDGIKGILPKRADGIVRPLLCVSRKEIEDYLKKISQKFVTDASNFEDVYTRNKIRLNLIPELIKNYNANLIEAVSENAMLIGMDSVYLNAQAKKLYSDMMHECENGFYIEVDEYNKIDKALALRVIRNAICTLRGSDKDISYDTVMRCDDLFGERETAKKVSLATYLFARREYDRVYFEKMKYDSVSYSYRAQIGETVYIKEANVSFRLSLLDKMQPPEKNCEYFDYNLLCGQIYIRSRKNGDRFLPFNMKGSKKLKDFFIDEKIKPSVRDILPLVVCDEQILWVCTLRRSNLYKVESETKKILKIEFWEGK